MCILMIIADYVFKWKSFELCLGFLHPTGPSWYCGVQCCASPILVEGLGLSSEACELTCKYNMYTHVLYILTFISDILCSQMEIFPHPTGPSVYCCVLYLGLFHTGGGTAG